MDVLEHWQPSIDWTKFKQGPVSDAVWSDFRDLVQLCHAYRHWKEETRTRQASPPVRPMYPESGYKRRKRREERRLEIRRAEDHMFRAAYLAADKLAMMSNWLDRDSEHNAADSKLYLALRFAIAPFPHERGRCSAAAFEAFDAASELSSPPQDSANRWLDRAGYP
jgi:hypothetical protein